MKRTRVAIISCDPVAVLGPDFYRLIADACIRSVEWQEGVLWPWRAVCHGTYAATKDAVQAVLAPRYDALVAALNAWNGAALDAPFVFPQPRGPLPLQWVDLCERGDRRGARPLDSVRGETAWFRPLFVWAMSYVIFPVGTRGWSAVDIPAAMAAAAVNREASWLRHEPAFAAFSVPDASLPDRYARYTRRWAQAPAHTVPAFLSTFCVWCYQGSPDMGAPGNGQYFTLALIKQAWPTLADLPGAIAFLLLWAQHTTFQTWVIDNTFLVSAIYELAVRLVSEWRGMRCIADGDNDHHWPLALRMNSHRMFTLWFGTRPMALAYKPAFLSYAWSVHPATCKKNQIAAMAAFDDLVERERLLDTDERSFENDCKDTREILALFVRKS
jgi:hypothetical protein